MKIWKNSVLFYLGGGLYMTLEFLWRGRSHWSMFLLGGLCFRLLGRLAQRAHRLSLWWKSLLGTGMITLLELITGLVFNRSYTIWDYRRAPLNLRGQICLPYMLLWLPLSTFGLLLHTALSQRLDRIKEHPVAPGRSYASAPHPLCRPSGHNSKGRWSHPPRR